MGHFWIDLADLSSDGQSWQGHAEQRGRYFAIRTIKRPSEAQSLPAQIEIPDYVVGLTEFGGLISYDIRSVPDNNVFGAPKISVRSYLGMGFAIGINPFDLASDGIVSMTAKYRKLVRWSDLRSSKIEHESYPDGRSKEITYSIRASEPKVGKTSDGFRVEIGSSWSAETSQFDQFSASTPLDFTVSKEVSSTWHEIIRPMRAFQDLVSLALGAFVQCVDGRITPDYKDEAEATSGGLWSGLLMDPPPGAKIAADNIEHPSFSFASIGGVDGVCRWIDLAEEHPRAVGPLTTTQRFGTSTAEAELFNIAVAIEYWVSACKKSATPRPAWTKGSEKQAVQLAKHVGQDFRDFVGGDEQAWAELFWDRYNALKHDPSISYDAYEVATLMGGARVLLMCALLNHVSGNSVPASLVCQSQQFYPLRQRTQKLLNSGPSLFRR